MGTRSLLAGILAGVGMFAWSAIAHMATPLGEAGMKDVPNEEAIIAAFKDLGSDRALYVFPAVGVGSTLTPAQKAATLERYTAKLSTTPSGLIVYNPPGRQTLTPVHFITELLTEILESLLAVYLLSKTLLRGFGAIVAFVSVIGVLAAVTTNIPYWNWDGFPTAYTVGYATTQIIGFIVAGCIIAAVLRNRPAPHLS